MLGTLPARCTRPACRGEAVDRPARPGGRHRYERACSKCGAWLGWVPEAMTPERARGVIVRFGQYRGRPLGWINDHNRGYLAWLATSGALERGQQEAADLILRES